MNPPLNEVSFKVRFFDEVIKIIIGVGSKIFFAVLQPALFHQLFPGIIVVVDHQVFFARACFFADGNLLQVPDLSWIAS